MAKTVRTPSVAFTGQLSAAGADSRKDTLLLGIWKKSEPAVSLGTLGFEGWVTHALSVHKTFKGKVGHTLTLSAPPCGRWRQVVLIGLGKRAKIDAPRARRAGAAAAAALEAGGATEVEAALGLPPGLTAQFALGARLRLHRTPSYRKDPDADAPPRPVSLTFTADDAAAARAAWAPLQAAAEGVEWARDLTARPGNILTPDTFAAEVLALAEHGVGVEILDETALARSGLNLHVAVGKASANPPRLVALRWRGGAADEAPVLLVGKGITFDSGGLCLKPPAGMEEMKGDMGGAATVAGVIHALAHAKAPVNVTGILALAENMPGGNATRPGDVIRSHAGLTVEVVDTDAEGRMVLADALSWGCATERPRAVIDLATLTGSIVTTLGRHTAGLFSPHTPDSDALAEALLAAGERTGEPLWRLPLTAAVDDDIKSECADIKQCAPAGRLLPDALHAARFLSHFVPGALPYAHLDIAGVAETEDARGLTPAGPTGFGTLLLVDWLTAQDR